MLTLDEVEAAADRLTVPEKEHLLAHLKVRLELDISTTRRSTVGDLLRIWKESRPDPGFADDLEKIGKSDTLATNPWDS